MSERSRSEKKENIVSNKCNKMLNDFQFKQKLLFSTNLSLTLANYCPAKSEESKRRNVLLSFRSEMNFVIDLCASKFNLLTDLYGQFILLSASTDN